MIVLQRDWSRLLDRREGKKVTEVRETKDVYS